MESNESDREFDRHFDPVVGVYEQIDIKTEALVVG